MGQSAKLVQTVIVLKVRYFITSLLFSPIMNQLKEYTISELKLVLNSMKVKFGRKNYEKQFYISLIDDARKRSKRMKEALAVHLTLLNKKKSSLKEKKKQESAPLIPVPTPQLKPAITTPLDVTPLCNSLKPGRNKVKHVIVESSHDKNDFNQIIVIVVISSFAIILAVLLIKNSDEVIGLLKTCSEVTNSAIRSYELPLILSGIMAGIIGGTFIYKHFRQISQRAEEIYKDLAKDSTDVINEQYLTEKALEMYEMKKDDFLKDIMPILADMLDKSENCTRKDKGTFEWSRTVNK